MFQSISVIDVVLSCVWHVTGFIDVINKGVTVQGYSL